MAPTETSSVKFDVKSPASKFFQAYMEKINFPYEGNAEMEMDQVGTEKKKTRLKVSGFKISKKWYKSVKATVTGDMAWQNPDCYKKLEGTMTIIANEDGEGAEAEWTVEFEKTRSDMDDPHYIIETCRRCFMEMDENLVKSD